MSSSRSENKQKDTEKEKKDDKERDNDNIIKKKETEKEISNEYEFEDNDDDDDDEEEEKEEDEGLDDRLREILKIRIKRSPELEEIVELFLDIYGGPLEVDTFDSALTNTEEWNNIIKDLKYGNVTDISNFKNNKKKQNNQQEGVEKEPMEITWRNSDIIFFKKGLKKLVLESSKNKIPNLPQQQQRQSRPQQMIPVYYPLPTPNYNVKYKQS